MGPCSGSRRVRDLTKEMEEEVGDGGGEKGRGGGRRGRRRRREGEREIYFFDRRILDL